MADIITTVISILLSGVLATGITILYQKRAFKHAEKVKIFETVMSYRYRYYCEENVRALNTIDVVFHNNREVRAAWKAFLDETDKVPVVDQNIMDKLVKLLEEMARAVGYKKINWDNIKKYYYPNGLSNQIMNEEMLKHLQVKQLQGQSDEKSLFNSNPKKNMSESDQSQNQLLAQLLPELLKNPDSFEKLINLSQRIENTKR
ncbi:MAG: hypothetical protein LLF87_11700 [Eubacteriales bacterium]|nr:hypothetical protein [Eubacteriales bacterium]